jgi:pimeloyl-ACP methyl ester carboxylesterase
MSAMTSNYLTCAGREIHYTEWGHAHAQTVIAWHGLARTGRDMDEVAAHLSQRYRVICPDTIGRGLSEWSPNPSVEYCLDFYVSLAVALVDQLELQHFHWLGTSMGGAIGLRAAAGRLQGRIRRLLLNDMGPELAAAAISRIRTYAGSPATFARVTELEQYLRAVYQPYGELTDAQWRRMAETSARRLPDGRVTPHYDPAMVQQFEHYPKDYDQWEAWDRLTIPVMCLRGEHSDLLLPQVAEAMTRRGPCAEVITVSGCGHAPALNVPAHFAWIDRFFDAADPVQGLV